MNELLIFVKSGCGIFKQFLWIEYSLVFFTVDDKAFMQTFSCRPMINQKVIILKVKLTANYLVSNIVGPPYAS